jgi:hypothetical protein
MKFSNKAAVGIIAVMLIFGSTTAAFAANSGAPKGKHSREFSGQFMESLSEEDKATLKEAHELFHEGKPEEAKALLEEAGLPAPRFGHRARGFMHRNPEVKDAIGNNDYTAFLAATADTRVGEAITEERFAIMVQAHQAHESGDQETARELMKSLHDELRAEHDQSE